MLDHLTRRRLLSGSCLIIAACTPGPRPEATVQRFVRAFNEKDLNTLLTCIDPKQERLFRASFRLIERFSGGRLPVEDLLELIPGLYQMFQGQVSQDIILRQVHVGRGRVTGEEADVPVSLEIYARSQTGENAQHQDLHFLLRRFDEGWRIVGIQNK